MSDVSLSSLNDKIALLERRITREKKAREVAEQLLAQKSRDIYVSNQMLKDALLESEQKHNELKFLLSTSGSLSLGANSENLLTNVTELTCHFLNAVWGLSQVQTASKPLFDVSTSICNHNKQWSQNPVFIETINDTLTAVPATNNWNIVDVDHVSIYPHALKMLYVAKEIDQNSVLLSVFLLKQAPKSAETFDALTIIQRQVKTFFIARKNGTVISETKDNLDVIQQQLTHAKSQLVQSEKMASLGQLAAGIAHEINNPISYIRSNLEVLSTHVIEMKVFLKESKDFILDNNIHNSDRFLNLIKQYDIEYLLQDTDEIVTSNLEGVERISDIIAGLKTFSHQGEADFRPLSIVDTVSAALKVVKNEVKYKHNVQHVMPDKDILVMGKLGQIQQVFVNLLVNAAQAMPDGGSIIIEYSMSRKECFIKVTDTGIGMSVDTQKQLFNPFYTTKPVGEGTGLGLSISYSILESHKGSIDVVSRLGKGSTFTVTLPLAFNTI